MIRIIPTRATTIKRALIFSLLFTAAGLRYAEATPRPNNSTSSEIFATASDGTLLHWNVYTPAGIGPWPAVLVVHGGNFRGGSPNGPDLKGCAQDLAAAGFIAFAIEYRLAPTGGLPGQVSLGQFPDQTKDVTLAVRAARRDPRCNGRVGVVGGSAGGYFAAYTASTGTNGDDRIDVGVSLSGSYDLSDFSPDPGITAFIDDVTNYVGVTTDDVDALRAASPAFLADADTAPLFMIRTVEDPMPYSQLGDMTTKLDALGVSNYEALTLPGSQHSFDYWYSVKDRAILFLASWFAGVPPPPPPLPSPTPDPTPPPPIIPPSPARMLLNVSTRARVDTGTKVTIGGFIVAGDVAKKVALRAIGPSLVGVANVLSDPVLELYDFAGNLIAQNDDSSTLAPGDIPAGLKPADGRESIISETLPPGSYTGVLRGANDSTGVGLFELYDLDPASSRLSNISTRGEVGIGSEVMIGGFIIGGEDPTEVVIRALGPSLSAQNVPNVLPDPLLELYDRNGSLIFANDNWRATQEQAIIATGLAPSDDSESAVVATLAPGAYTAIVRDADQASGVALIEVYNLESK
jgi:acetyl esterase/lipase